MNAEKIKEAARLIDAAGEILARNDLAPCFRLLPGTRETATCVSLMYQRKETVYTVNPAQLCASCLAYVEVTRASLAVSALGRFGVEVESDKVRPR